MKLSELKQLIKEEVSSALKAEAEGMQNDWKQIMHNAIEEMRTDFVKNYYSKFAGMDLDFVTVLQMTFGIDESTAWRLNKI